MWCYYHKDGVLPDSKRPEEGTFITTAQDICQGQRCREFSSFCSSFAEQSYGEEAAKRNKVYDILYSM